MAKRKDVVEVDREVWEYAISLLDRWTRTVHADSIEAETCEFLAGLKVKPRKGGGT